ncbi:hypothetical protein [Ochrobactrum sp. BTU2]|uniref:hypothetical protein n=1 Tax=Ochrobactrum sp. BTU2 TaxID=2856166 RepID=UPI00211A6505|nr:hypothetical protein [Ochrobactrum sp. BTU2]MCQ9146181.1 hypothetical protein [Ochrobactrum sp. BTU2]
MGSNTSARAADASVSPTALRRAIPIVEWCSNAFRESWSFSKSAAISTLYAVAIANNFSSDEKCIQIVPLWLVHKGMKGAGRRSNAVRFRQGTKIHQNTNRFHRSRRSPWRDERARYFASRFMAGAHPFTQSSTAFE